MLEVTPIPALESNYFWLIRPNSRATIAYVVDPGTAAPVIAQLEQQRLQLGAILITHHHRDHIQGIEELVKRYKVPVFGPSSKAIPQITHPLAAADLVPLGGLTFEVLGVPGHTLDHIAYLLRDPSGQHPASHIDTPQVLRLFCGDALFAGGCGRRFEGSAEMMWDSLERLAALPESTLIYCAHEYTLANLRFACEVEPDNRALQERLQAVELLRQQQLISLPSNIGIEKRTNPFLRCHLPQLKAYAENHAQAPLGTAAQVFGELRKIKDSWS